MRGFHILSLVVVFPSFIRRYLSNGWEVSSTASTFQLVRSYCILWPLAWPCLWSTDCTVVNLDSTRKGIEGGRWESSRKCLVSSLDKIIKRTTRERDLHLQIWNRTKGRREWRDACSFVSPLRADNIRSTTTTASDSRGNIFRWYTPISMKFGL